MHSDAAKYLSEFLGTYFLVLTIGCNVLTGSVGAAVSIGSMLMIMIYALGSVSGAHFNPAVTVAVLLASPRAWRGNLAQPFGKYAAMYVLFQLLGGLCAAFTYYAITRDAFTLAPVGKYHWGVVIGCEMFYSFALVYVVLNCACAKKGDGNQFFGIAIGFTVLSAALSIGGISGCSLNPAVSFGTLVVAAVKDGMGALTYLPLYFFVPFLGSGIGFGAFFLVRRDEWK